MSGKITLISLINVEVGINVEGVQNMPTHYLNVEIGINVECGILWKQLHSLCFKSNTVKKNIS